MINMTQEEILQNNILIAEFMGYQHQIEEWCGSNTLQYQEIGDYHEMIPFKPESRWDDLMPVVEKIEGLDEYSVVIKKKVVIIQRTKYSCFKLIDENISITEVTECTSKIEAAWLAVVDFIRWYNEKTNENK
jgi:hypothetical protein